MNCFSCQKVMKTTTKRQKIPKEMDNALMDIPPKKIYTSCKHRGRCLAALDIKEM